MKNLKLLTSFAVIIFVMVAIFSCAAQHEHEFSNEWTSDETHHWHACGDESCTGAIDSAEHTFGAAKVKVPATETEDGVVSFACMVCGFEKTETVDKLTHSHEIVKQDYVAPTCAKEGVEEYYSCATCGALFEDANGKFALDAPVAIEKLAHVDADSNHKCDKCTASVGAHEAAEGTHDCAYCGKSVTECTPEADDGDCTTAIYCSVCGEELTAAKDEHISAEDDGDCTTAVCCTECTTVLVEANATHVFHMGTHTCLECGITLSTCADNDNNHRCDACDKALSTCVNENADHNCDICGKTLSYCSDSNNDHNCDLCGKTLTKCADGNNNHKCDLCNKVVSDCVDTDKNHVCDICKVENSECYDNNNNHKCDLCDAVLTACADNTSDHKCDVCGEVLTECSYDAGVITTPATCVAEGVKTYTCQICGGTKTEPVDATGIHNDGNKDGACDVCAKDLKIYTRLEAEHAENHCPAGIGAVQVEVSADGRSNGQSIGYFNAAGQVLVFVINSDKAEQNVTFTFSATSNEIAVITPEILNSMIANNGVAIKNVTTGITTNGWTGFSTTTGTIDLVEGKNVITVTQTGTTMNIDYLELATVEAKISWTPIVRNSAGVVALTQCVDANKDHSCDSCRIVLSTCADKYDAGVVTKAPNCTEEGSKLYTCTVCGSTKVETLPVAHVSADLDATGSLTYDATTGAFDYSGLTVNLVCSGCGKSDVAAGYTVDVSNMFTTGLVINYNDTKVTLPAFTPANYTTSSAKTGGNDPAPVVTTTFVSDKINLTVISNNFFVADGKTYSRYELSLLCNENVNVSYDGNTYIYEAKNPVTLTQEIRTYGCMLTIIGDVNLNLGSRWTHNNGVILGTADKTANVVVYANGNAIFFWDGADLIINKGSSLDLSGTDVFNVWSGSAGTQILVDGKLTTHGHIFLLASADWAHPEGDNYNLNPNLYIRNGEVEVNNGNIYVNFAQVGSVKNNYTGKLTINNGGFAKRDENIDVQIRWAFSKGELNFNNNGGAITGAMITDQNNKDRAITFDSGIKVTVKGAYNALIRHQWSSWANVAVHTDAKFDLPESTNFYCMSNNYSDSNINFWNSATIMLDGREQTVWVANESQFKVSGQVKDFTRNEILPVVNADGTRSAAKVVPAAGSYTTTDGNTVVGDWESICKKAVNENGDVIYYIVK